MPKIVVLMLWECSAWNILSMIRNAIDDARPDRLQKFAGLINSWLNFEETTTTNHNHQHQSQGQIQQRQRKVAKQNTPLLSSTGSSLWIKRTRGFFNSQHGGIPISFRQLGLVFPCTAIGTSSSACLFVDDDKIPCWIFFLSQGRSFLFAATTSTKTSLLYTNDQRGRREGKTTCS